MKKPVFLMVGLMAVLLIQAPDADAFLYHAARKAAAKSILRRGFSPGKFRANTRFGKGVYTSRKPSTALAEKGRGNVVLRFREGAFVNRTNTLDLKRPSAKRLHELLGRNSDLRGTVKNRVIGPKAGRRLGRIAGEQGKIIEYRSSKGGGGNVFIPEKLFRARPGILRNDGTLKK